MPCHAPPARWGSWSRFCSGSYLSRIPSCELLLHQNTPVKLSTCVSANSQEPLLCRLLPVLSQGEQQWPPTAWDSWLLSVTSLSRHTHVRGSSSILTYIQLKTRTRQRVVFFATPFIQHTVSRIHPYLSFFRWYQNDFPPAAPMGAWQLLNYPPLPPTSHTAQIRGLR